MYYKCIVFKMYYKCIALKMYLNVLLELKCIVFKMFYKCFVIFMVKLKCIVFKMYLPKRPAAVLIAKIPKKGHSRPLFLLYIRLFNTFDS